MVAQRISINIPEEIYNKITAIAKATKRTKTDIIVEALREYLDEAYKKVIMGPLLERLEYSALYYFDYHMIESLVYYLTRAIMGEDIPTAIYMVDIGTLRIIRKYLEEITDENSNIDVHYVNVYTLMGMTDYLIKSTIDINENTNVKQIFLFENNSDKNIWHETWEELMKEFLDEEGELLPEDKRRGKFILVRNKYQNAWFTLVRHRKPFIAILGVKDLELLVKYKKFKLMVREFDREFVEKGLELKFHPVEYAIFSRTDVIQSYIP